MSKDKFSLYDWLFTEKVGYNFLRIDYVIAIWILITSIVVVVLAQ